MKLQLKDYIRRTLVIFPASPLLAFGISLTVHAGLGSDVLTSFEQGIAQKIGSEVGTMALAFNAVVLLIYLFVNRSYIHIGSFVLSLSLGPFITLFVGLLQRVFPGEYALWQKILFILVGIVFIVFSLSWYNPIQLGIQPLDMLIYTAAKLTHRTYGVGMYIVNALLFIGTLLLGAPWGIGTLINFACVGKLVDLVMPRIAPLVRRLAGMTSEGDTLKL